MDAACCHFILKGTKVEQYYQYGCSFLGLCYSHYYFMSSCFLLFYHDIVEFHT